MPLQEQSSLFSRELTANTHLSHPPEGQVTNSQLFAFTAGETSLALKPQNGNGATCLVPQGAKLGSAACDNAADQTFTIA